MEHLTRPRDRGGRAAYCVATGEYPLAENGFTAPEASTEITIQEQATDSNTQSSQTDGNSRTGLWTTLHITNQNYEAAEESYEAALEIFEMI